MVCSAIYKQWGYVVNEFEEGVKAQQEFITQKNLRGSEPDEYDAGWLRFWEYGLFQARACQRSTRFSFLTKPAPDDRHLLIGFLCQIRLETLKSFSEDNRYRDGMIEALDGTIEWAFNDVMN